MKMVISRANLDVVECRFGHANSWNPFSHGIPPSTLLLRPVIIPCAIRSAFWNGALYGGHETKGTIASWIIVDHLAIFVCLQSILRVGWSIEGRDRNGKSILSLKRGGCRDIVKFRGWKSGYCDFLDRIGNFIYLTFLFEINKCIILRIFKEIWMAWTSVRFGFKK